MVQDTFCRMNSRTEQGLRRILDVYAQIPEVSVQWNAPDDGTLQITGHAPLEEVPFRFLCHNRFWSREYILELSVKSQCPLRGSVRIRREKHRFSFQTGSREMVPLCEELTSNDLLQRTLACANLSRLVLRTEEGAAAVSLQMHSSRLERVLFPPMSSAIVSTVSECAAQLASLQMLLVFLRRGTN